MNNLPKQNEFDKLKAGILLAYQNKRNREPEYEAVYYFSNKSSALSKMNQYASDIEKIIREINFTESLIAELPEEAYLKKLNIMSEDYILYHKGYFLELIHQLKDKLVRLVDAFSKINEEKFTEPDKIKINKVCCRSLIERNRDLIKLLKEWDRNLNLGIGNPIVLSLQERTNNHHFRSRLSLESCYQDIKLSRLMKELQSQKNLLTDYGVEQIKKKGEVGFKTWHDNTIRNVSETKKYAFNNLEQISRLLRLIFHLPNQTEKKGEKILRITNSYYATREIVNKTSLEKFKLTGSFCTLAECVLLSLEKIISDQIVSFYIIGSVARGESKLGISDLNIVLITKDNLSGLADTIYQVISESQIKAFSKILIDIDIVILSREQFLHMDNFKTAFLCKYDGLLIKGDDLAAQKRYPSPGLGLAYLLNRDFKDKTVKTKEYLKLNPQISDAEIMKIVRKIVKDALRMMFGEVMSNYAMYVIEKEKIKESLIWAHPDNWQTVARIYKFLGDNILTDKATLEALLDVLCTEKLFPLLDDLENKSKNWFVDWQKNY